MVTQERLKQLFHYDPETGVFIRRVTHGNQVKGKIAGSMNHGYICIGVDMDEYPAHRLAWLYMTGEWPEYQLDHADYDRSNNRFANLREATHSENGHNRGANKNCLSSLKGVHWDKRRNKWYVRIMNNHKNNWLGYFEDKYQAALEYDKAAIKLHGEFARTNFPTRADLDLATC